MKNWKHFNVVFVVMVLFFLFFGTFPLFSQELLATFGFGGQFLNPKGDQMFVDYIDDRGSDGNFYDYSLNKTIYDAGTMGVNILFIGKSGFTISFGLDIPFGAPEGINIQPIIGAGYIYYNKFYFGGIINLIPTLSILRWEEEHGIDRKLMSMGSDLFIVPTITGGYDFGSVLLGGQLAYMRGAISSINGFKFSIVVGVNLLHN